MKRTLRVTMLLCGLMVYSFIASVRGDLVKLKDGTVLDGTILTEDDKQVVIDAEFASGTITKRETVRKSDIIEIKRSSEAEKAERQMQRDYERARKYQLDPTNSLPLATYEQVINGVLRKFLTQYTNSPYQKEISEELAQWQAERDLVAAGQVKYRGQWLPSAEAAKVTEQDRARRLLEEGRSLLSKGRFDEAIQRFQNLARTGKLPETVSEARRLEAESYRQWLASLQQQKQSLTNEIQATEQRASSARQEREAAEQKHKALQSEMTSGGTKLGQQSILALYYGDITRAQSIIRDAENRLADLRSQSRYVERQISEVQSSVASAPAPPPPEPKTNVVAQAPPAPVVAAESPELLSQILKWVQQYWMFLAGGLLIGLWLIARLFTRR
jgi:hypothetical protein